MIFSFDKYCVCPKDIEIYLSAIFLCLAAALPHHINLSPKTCRPMTRNKYQRKKMEELLLKYLTTFLFYFHYLCLTDYRSNISEILIKFILTISKLLDFI